ncbi:MAG: amino acid racemase [Candidatus Bathyarchaeota archaeon]|nr:MAG: amino acid racemase [Candidatus Bathyarchaeota archaeon]
MEEGIIGILGGMGPEATADLFYRIIHSTPVEKDQDHVRVVIYSNSKVPDRTAAILGGGPSPVPEMVKAAKALEGAGADFLIMPCNTAHHFIEDVRESVGVPVLDMIGLTSAFVSENHPGVKRVGLIATDGTLSSSIYHQRFEEQGVEVLTPEEGPQREVMEAIYGHVKTGDLEGGREILLRAASSLVDAGAGLVIPGCTEVSLVVGEGDVNVPVVDPLQVLAEEAVARALGGS